MTNQVIPARAVEAAAKAAFTRTHPHGNFRLAVKPMQERYLEEARAALEAAAPYMLDQGGQRGNQPGIRGRARRRTKRSHQVIPAEAVEAGTITLDLSKPTYTPTPVTTVLVESMPIGRRPTP